MLDVPRTNLVGKKFHSWTVLARGGVRVQPSGHRRGQWWCQCKCGHKQEVLGAHLTSGQSRSCLTCGHEGKRKPFNPEGAMKMHRMGLGWPAIARRLGVHPMTVRTRLKRLGFDTGPTSWIARDKNYVKMRRLHETMTWRAIYAAVPAVQRNYADAVLLSRAYWRETGRRRVREIDRTLSRKRWQVHDLTERGFSTRQIAQQLSMPPRNVTLYRKLPCPVVPVPPVERIRYWEAHRRPWLWIWTQLGRLYESPEVLKYVTDYFESRMLDTKVTATQPHFTGDEDDVDSDRGARRSRQG